MRARTDCSSVFDDLRRFIGVPRLAVNQQVAVGCERWMKREHLRMRAGINDSSVNAPHLTDAVADDSTNSNVGFCQAFARQRLYRIAPQLSDPHYYHHAGAARFTAIEMAHDHGPQRFVQNRQESFVCNAL